MTQTREKWGSLVLSRTDFCVVWRCHMVFCFIFYFLFKSNGKKEHLDENNSRHGYGNYVKSAALKVSWFQLCSTFFLNNYETHWQRHLKDISQLKILPTWINIQANSFLGTCHEMKMGEGARDIINCTKIRVYSLKNIAPGHFTYYRIVLCLSNKPSF